MKQYFEIVSVFSSNSSEPLFSAFINETTAEKMPQDSQTDDGIRITRHEWFSSLEKATERLEILQNAIASNEVCFA